LFAHPIPTIIHKLKYKSSFALAEPLAGLMAEAWSDWQTTVDLVVPIPLHPQKKKERGYNQSALLAYHLCQRLGLLYDSEALWRKRYTEPQVHLSIADRMTNVEGAFGASHDRVAGKEILLIDDVCTTGATLSAATVALLAEGAKTVSAYCLARAI
jgi:ComF family protein